MRKVFIQCADRRTAARRCSWACAIAKVEGGYLCFESSTDYYIWKGHK